MEECGQILEVETFIPMLIQKPENGINRLSRIVFIGDHNQLPPIVQNPILQRYSLNLTFKDTVTWTKACLKD